MNWIGRDWGPRADIEAGAKAGPFLIREKAIVYRCPFCRKSWRAQAKKRAERHLIHCFERPDRVPYLGELSHAFMHEDAPWHPGDGKIWDGKQWRDVPGYRGMEHPWPIREAEEGQPLDRVTPWWTRLSILGHDTDRFLHGDDRYPRTDEDIIRAIHGSAP